MTDCLHLDDLTPNSNRLRGKPECGHSTEGTSMQSDGSKTGDETGRPTKSDNCGCSSNGTPNTSPDGFRYIADAAWGLLENAHQNVYDDQGRYGYWVHDGDVCALLDELRLFDPEHKFRPRNPNPPMRVEFGGDLDQELAKVREHGGFYEHWDATRDHTPKRRSTDRYSFNLNWAITICAVLLSGSVVAGGIWWLASSLFGG